MSPERPSAPAPTPASPVDVRAASGSAPGRSARTARSRRLGVSLAVLVVAAGLRFAGLGFGLPMAEARPDELTIAFQAMKFGTGDLNPHSFNYPSLHKYVTFALFGVKYVLGRVTGAYASKDDFLRDFFDGAVGFRLWMRAWSATMGTVAVALLLRAPGRAASAALLAVSMLAVRDSHFGVTDTMMVTLVIAAVGLADRAARTGRTGDLLLAAAIAGLATSTKYTAGLLALPLALAALPRPAAGSPYAAPAGGLGLLDAAWPRLLRAAAVMVAAFALGSPYVVLDFPTFWKDFQYEAAHLDQGQYIDVGRGWSRHLLTLGLTEGWALVALGLGGGALALVAASLGASTRDGRRRALLWLAFPVSYWLLIGRGHTAFFRYALPLVPFLCVGAGTILAPLPRALAWPLGLAVALPTAWGALQVDRLLLAGDTRDAMGRWIEANVPGEAVIIHAGAYTGAPMLQRNVANQTREYQAKLGRADSAGFRKPDDQKWYNAARPMYDVLFIEKPGIDFASRLAPPALAGRARFWLELEDYPLSFYASVPDAVRRFATACTVAHRERATDDRATADDLDQQDALYLPAANFGAFDRTGPNLTLYRCVATQDGSP